MDEFHGEQCKAGHPHCPCWRLNGVTSIPPFRVNPVHLSTLCNRRSKKLFFFDSLQWEPMECVLAHAKWQNYHNLKKKALSHQHTSYFAFSITFHCAMLLWKTQGKNTTVKWERRGNERTEKAFERQVESTVAVATSPINGKPGYHVAKVRLCRQRQNTQKCRQIEKRETSELWKL